MAKKFEIQKQGFGSVAAAYNDLAWYQERKSDCPSSPLTA